MIVRTGLFLLLTVAMWGQAVPNPMSKRQPADNSVAAPRTPMSKPLRKAAKPAASKSDLTPVTSGPGEDIGDGYRACVPGDKTPVGTVMDGVKKISISTPMGSSCRWAPVE